MWSILKQHLQLLLCHTDLPNKNNDISQKKRSFWEIRIGLNPKWQVKHLNQKWYQPHQNPHQFIFYQKPT